MRGKKIISLALIAALALAACSDDDAKGTVEPDSKNFNKTGMPIVNETIKLDIFAGKSATTADDWNDVLILNEYEKMSNIDITWQQVPADGLQEKRNLALASGTLPDVFYAATIPVGDLQKYGQQGTFIPLNDLIEDYAPNLSKILEANPEIKKGLTFPDGNIYSFPTIYSPEFTSLLIGAKPWIKQDWLDQLGMKNPENLDELYAYLKAVKETDLNGNGKNDEIPLSSVSMTRILHWISGAFGVQNKGSLHTLLDTDSAGELRFFPTSPEYKEMLEYMHKLYSEGLIDQGIYSIDVPKYLAAAAEELYGATQFYNPIELFGEEIGKDYVVGNALAGPSGEKLYTGVTSPLRDLGNFAITSENKYPAETVRWLDHFYSDEGALMFFMGIEGETFEQTADGPKLLDKITNSKDGLTMTQELAKYLINPGGNHPVMITDDYFTGSENAPGDIEATKELEPYLIDEVWPNFTYTAEENDQVSVLKADIDKYVQEMQAKFITGETPLTEWDSYVGTIEKMGLKDFMELQQKAYERYKD